VECGSDSDTGNNRSDWNQFRITQTIPEQHTGKAQNYGPTKHSHIGYWTQTAGSANVKVYKTYFTHKITLHVAQTVNAKQLQPCVP